MRIPRALPALPVIHRELRDSNRHLSFYRVQGAGQHGGIGYKIVQRRQRKERHMCRP
jgi:hypothetical protein